MDWGRILVVDDEAHIRTTVKMVLTKAGYDVVEAEDGEKGIHAITSDDNSLMVDMILCDMQMPKCSKDLGSGPRACGLHEQARAHRPSLRYVGLERS